MVTTTTAADLVRQARAVLLDFDGPVTPLMPPPANSRAADAAREAVPAAAEAMPSDIASTTDHLTVLRWAGTQSPAVLEAVEKACIEAEISAARTSKPTPGALNFLRACAEAEKPVVIVSNNSPEAVHVYLTRHDANRLVRGVVGRAPHHPELMKPHPSFVLAALDLIQVEPRDAVLIGDSVTDVEVGHASGVDIIGYAKTPPRGRELATAGAEATTEAMALLSPTI
ncbi:HAD family hydrolase [Segeticoccus rhizosphaerae]|uniref:HAD family hydrolase n=1 Tax=Segeticoccus rhizosphaerae TaxID=1104777 RepID=UPI001264419C|nr:HAD family phosphatase [Segeticoccus rhizosphaerae]